MAGNNLRDALVEEIKDLYNAEKQLTKALPKLAKAATSSELRDAFEMHLEETEGHVAKLESVFEMLDEKVRGKHCAGIAGIIEEGSDTIQEEMEDSVKDACLIASGQRAEHYEIGAYGTAIAWAKALELTDVADALGEILAEEKAADEKLTALAESGINEAATSGADMDDEEEEEDEDEQPRATRSSEPATASARSASARSASGTAKTATRQRGGRR